MAKLIDLETESLLSLREAARVVPRLDGHQPHVSTVWRWCRLGVAGVKLDYARLGRRIVTSREALNRFANALALADTCPSPEKLHTMSRNPPSHSPSQPKIEGGEVGSESKGLLHGQPR